MFTSCYFNVFFNSFFSQLSDLPCNPSVFLWILVDSCPVCTALLQDWICFRNDKSLYMSDTRQEFFWLKELLFFMILEYNSSVLICMLVCACFFHFQAKVLRLLATTYFEWDCSLYLDKALKAISLANQVVIFAPFRDSSRWNSSIYWYDNMDHIHHWCVILDNMGRVCFMFPCSYGCFDVPSFFFFYFVEKYENRSRAVLLRPMC